MRGASPYSTGGGGTVLEHRYGALLLSHLLTADPLAELGDDVTPREVTFQASAFSAVDDLLVSGYSSDGTERRVSIGVRRNPSFVPSNESSVDLIGSYLSVINEHPLMVESGQWRLALAVASPNIHVQQVRELANIARDVLDERHFRADVARPGRTTQSIRERLVNFDKVVASAAKRAGIDTTLTSASELSWRLLRAFRLRELRLEGVDESDRTLAVGRLRQITAPGTADAADKLFSRLSELVGRYAPAAATKNESSLRSDLVGTALVKPYDEAVFSSGRRADITDSAAADLTRAGPTVRSDYLSQVQRIAPEQLLGREQELAYLVDFCTSSTSKSYLWWRAKAWSGKSALLSSFVLNPPAGVRVVSFFITARLAGQSDRTAFSEVILEQVLELIGEPIPILLTDATRDAHLLGTLTRAAEICQERGERLILVVDGLDEDQGVTAGPDAHSIAAVLPTAPPANMRVVTSSRPHPPIPSDVPDDHPLRCTAIIRQLAVSPNAEVVRQDAERELKRLLRGSEAEQDLLGLLTAAGGGLSGADLAKLTGLSIWEIEDFLRAVSGRTFAARAGHWRPATVVYMLGHEELQRQAAKFIGANRLESYRNRLHSWAEEYSHQNWPGDTPEYLLRGYFRLLYITGDTSRILMCATDTDRHDRMLDIIGGDSAALGEIITAQEIITKQAAPDLLEMSRLAVHRAKLVERNDNIPASLPGVWAQLGRPGRAEALARSISDQYRQVQALAAVGREVAVNGDLRRARLLSNQAELIIPSIADPYQQAQALTAVARVAAKAGELRQAVILFRRSEVLARSLTSRSRQAHVLVAVARAAAIARESNHAKSIALSIPRWSERAQALGAIAVETANSGDWRSGRRIALSIANRSERAQALAGVARAVSVAGNQHRSREIAGEAEAIARSVRNPDRRAWTLVPVAEALANSGLRRKATAIIELAEQLAASITKASDREDTLTAIARVTVISGNPDHAEEIARNITSPYRRVVAFVAVSSGLAVTGYQHRAEMTARKAETIARSITRNSLESGGLAALSQAVAATGDLSRAEAIVRSIPDLLEQERAMTVITQAMATKGELDRAETIALSITDPDQQAKALSLVAGAEAASGEIARAENIARSINDPRRRAKVLAAISCSAVNDDDVEQLATDSGINASSRPDALAGDMEEELKSGDLHHAETIASSISDPYRQFKALTAAAQSAAIAGAGERAEEIVNCITNRQLRTRALTSVSVTMANAGDSRRAQRLIDQAITVANSIASASSHDLAITTIAQHLASIGDPSRAEKIVRSINDLSGLALSTVAVAIAEIGELERAEKMVLSIPNSSRQAKALAAIVQAGIRPGNHRTAERIARSITDPLPQAQALSAVAQALADAGQLEYAEKVARSITDATKQAQTLIALTTRLNSDEARNLLAYALTIGHWQICLKALIRIEPDVVNVIADEFLGMTDLVKPI